MNHDTHDAQHRQTDNDHGAGADSLRQADSQSAHDSAGYSHADEAAQPVSPLPYRDVDEASRIFLLPNIFTAGNLFFGFIAIIWCIHGRYVAGDEEQAKLLFTQAVFFILFAGVCDLFDGRVARMGGRESLFGKEFDSIADVVSFGLAPALMVFFLILHPTESYPFFRQIGWLIGFIYLLCAGIRLARFNVITNPFIPQTKKSAESAGDFQGLPAPAAAGMIASVVLVMLNYDFHRELYLALPPLLLLIAYMMVSHVVYPSFKHIGWRSRIKLQHFILLVVGVVVMVTFWKISFAIVFIVYLFYGLVRHMRREKVIRRSASAVKTAVKDRMGRERTRNRHGDSESQD